MNRFASAFYQPIKRSSHSEAGLTLLEVTVAIVMLGVILTAMAPPLLISAATRVKLRRASQARLIAQEEVNRVQGIMMRSRDENLPTDNQGNYIGLPPISNSDNLTATPAPSDLTAVRQVDVDQDGEDDFFVQAFREEGALFAAGEAQCEPAVFRMGVRVYSMLAAENLGNLQKEKASLQMADGLGEQSTHPMAVLYSEISRSDRDLSLDAYRDYLAGNGVPAACP
jgi:type II secretory pathway pseudopilin PulG